MTIHALELTMPVAERIATYIQRPTGSVRKLSTVWDGLRILRVIVRLTKNERVTTSGREAKRIAYLQIPQATDDAFGSFKGNC